MHKRSTISEHGASDVDQPARDRMRHRDGVRGSVVSLSSLSVVGTSPPLLLADEPTGNLDTEAVDRVLALFGRLREEHRITIVLVTHDRDVAGHCDRTVTMRDGRVVDRQPDILKR